MCHQYNEHIHVSINKEGISYSTSCSDCFSHVLENPEILSLIQTKEPLAI